MTQINQIRSNGFTQVRTLEYGSRGLTSKNNNLYLREANNRERIGENTRSENVTKTMKKTKISQMNEKTKEHRPVTQQRNLDGFHRDRWEIQKGEKN